MSLLNEIIEDPLSRGYAQMTDAEIVVSLNAPDRPSARRIAVGPLVQQFDTMTDSNGLPVWEGIEAAAAQTDTTLGVVARQALRLRDARPDYPPVNVQSPAMQLALDTFVGAGLLQEDDRNHIEALALGSRAEELGLGRVTERDVFVSRGGE